MSAPNAARVLRTSATRSLRTNASSASRPRTMATRSGGASAASESSFGWSSRVVAASTLASAFATAYYMRANATPIMLEPRPSFSDRLKAKKSSGDDKGAKDVKETKPAEPEPAKETPDAIEVAAEEVTEQGEQQSAYDPETGEINWDCPCLGGMAHGPCGEQFKAAFSCFVYSEEEPKGINCVDKFKAMQDCFREYPEIYKDEIDDDEAASQEAEGGDGKGASKDDKKSDDGGKDDEPKRERNAALGGEKKEGGPARSGTATTDVDNRGGPNPDKIEKDDPERRKREHDVFANRAGSGATPRG
ncbi:uncharacterized protein PFL1_02524 [Pseudozyma flocculosa PF-1]|uniref:Mitochondrial intermembrane space import and assembly protein 40 n=2 Tax=Pseudozyma flocculosa TaxID=84751 RepID=A0A5C3F0D9_9BASI|nr:uncharacterized protein PFL1_02524 [Pseudozyma flocculosa PF-1]EPQ29851.1 hypothetical protein PFL1_02524 [Pseudozyma flocculosa PF-1]SPO37147.1 related to Mitochondrial intermembrane space import and assembly protein 40 [Pseudozyma flocculosa]